MSTLPTPKPPLLAFIQPESQLARRERAAQLLEAVVEERIEPCMAINRWPESNNHPDPSLDCAYLALWHFEADEDKQKTEVFYLDAQLELLQQMANFLKSGQDLPPYILKLYLEAHPVRFYYPRSAWQASMNYLRNQFLMFKQAWQRVLGHS